MNNRINLSMNEDTLARLIQAGHLCAADLGFLDLMSKQKVWRLCLWCCKNRFVNAENYQPKNVTDPLIMGTASGGST